MIQGTPTATPTAQPELPMIVPEFDLLKSKIVREAMMSLRPEKLKEHLQYVKTLQVIDAKGDVVMDAGMHEAAIPGIDTDSVPGYLAYSPTGTVEGDIIFVNYGTYPDFDKLEKNNISVKGFICLARYGGGHRGEKVRNCHERGGIATIIFSDPKAVSPLGLDKVYPNSQFVDGTALQRGALYTYGDPETPGYPSIKEALRYPNTSDMPQIPGLVIGYDDARLLFGYMGGDVVETTPELTAKWNMTYRRGPLKPEHAGMKVRLTVNNEWKRVEVFNVIGVLKGSHEPDRYSMLGNHHDAWARGTIDPSSATAPMLEQAYVLGQLVKKGIWRPRRSIIFGVWAAEEIAIAGSGEWVEARPSFVPYASPSLKNTFYTAAQLVPHGNQTLLEFWREFENVIAPALPDVRLTHGGADNNAFNFYAGIPAVALTFRPDPKKYSATYASYHTAYETVDLYERFIDKDYSGMKRCAQTQLVLTLYLSEAELLPYNMMDLGDALSTAYGKLEPKFTPYKDHTIDIGEKMLVPFLLGGLTHH
ncbi:glutamate carboxypeptidase, putative [Ixodes scapularis]|uniref:Glutamate carboxypeptidase, putative n=1 Tax=Ixodes scapularis TaxID=6945 RepID=B7QCN9_IXOSC|nr:glutamate carboxypeptidase, putative [Ixodes scapularis]|eukprot:XP_002413303.1 glutamate carboxypeptidase, putative [Ixodes scapularis]